MPKAVADEGNADYVLPLDKIGGVITDLVSALDSGEVRHERLR
jgi:chemotaxis response regulator CheB